MSYPKECLSVKSAVRSSHEKRLCEITRRGCTEKKRDSLVLFARRDFMTKVEWGGIWVFTMKQHKTGHNFTFSISKIKTDSVNRASPKNSQVRPLNIIMMASVKAQVKSCSTVPDQPTWRWWKCSFRGERSDWRTCLLTMREDILLETKEEEP